MLTALATTALAAARPAALGRRAALCAGVAGAVRPRSALALPVELETELAIFDSTLRQPLPAIDPRRQAEKLRDAQVDLDPRALAAKLAYTPGTPIPGPKATLRKAGVDVDAIGSETAIGRSLGAARSAAREGAEAQAKGLMITREEVERLQRAGAEKIAAERGR